MLIAAGTPEFVWYLMRGSGLVALMLFTLTVSLGVVSVTRLQSPRWPRLVTGELHRNVALLASCFLALHVGTALVDSWVGLNWIGVLFPFQSAYRPLWVGFGVLAFDVFLAILATSLLRRRIGARVWRLVHWGTWVMWPLALSHALGSGTDTTSGWGLGICVACIATVGAAATWRVCWVLRSHRHPQRGRVHPTPRGPGDTPAVVGAFGHPGSDVGAPRSVLPASLR